MREDRVPSNFSQKTDGIHLENLAGGPDLSDGRKIREQIIGLLAAERSEPGKPRLNIGLAQAINLAIGRYLEDDLPISVLGIDSYSMGNGEDSSVVDPDLRTGYTRAFRSLKKSAGCSTIGSIRRLSPGKFLAVGAIGLKFFQTAFARPQIQG